jgi:tetratricopeptide (TPR) repeat protein
MKDGNYDKALSFFSTYKPGEILYPDAMYSSGYCKFMNGDYKEAIEDWETAKKEGMPDCDNRLAQAYFKLGNQYHQEKKYPPAIACYTKSLELVPDVNVLFNRGISYLYLGEKEKACEDWKRVMELGSEESLPLIQEYCE